LSNQENNAQLLCMLMPVRGVSVPQAVCTAASKGCARLCFSLVSGKSHTPRNYSTVMTKRQALGLSEFFTPYSRKKIIFLAVIHEKTLKAACFGFKLRDFGKDSCM